MERMESVRNREEEKTEERTWAWEWKARFCQSSVCAMHIARLVVGRTRSRDGLVLRSGEKL
jgi:hypothetical protein